jgi:hypothetical protein
VSLSGKCQGCSRCPISKTITCTAADCPELLVFRRKGKSNLLEQPIAVIMGLFSVRRTLLSTIVVVAFGRIPCLRLITKYLLVQSVKIRTDLPEEDGSRVR